ncbi:uncharacterized protein LOC107368205 [Tetranychus urticae]|uniref:uncharacterized protein LOC107368205 n=1 Tax=Tetranychus urticae TaxID=32264 RepID=UPI00077BC30A|nr:uncharacterized protein LOC107368205 [Tetranychus urticae]
MNENDSNSNKTTIRVKLLDDYQDIVIDWNAEESEEIHKSILEQLSTFTRIPSEKIEYATFNKPSNGLTYPENPFAHSLEPDISILRYHWNSCGFKMQDMRDHFFTDGDCFIFNIMLELPFELDKVYVEYFLVHQDLVDETECSPYLCLHTCNRAFLDKIAGIFNSDFESYLLAQSRRIIFDEEHLARVDRRKNEILAHFNIGQYFDDYCCRSHYISTRGTINRPQNRIYLPYRG